MTTTYTTIAHIKAGHVSMNKAVLEKSNNKLRLLTYAASEVLIMATRNEVKQVGVYISCLLL